MGPRRGRVAGFAVGAVVLGLVLLRPASPPDVTLPDPTPFRWDADSVFATLEGDFVRARALEREVAGTRVDSLVREGRALTGEVDGRTTTPFGVLARIAAIQFQLAVFGAGHPTLLAPVEGFIVESRVAVMRAAASWPSDRATHEALYRVVLGGRIALEEALVQAGPGARPALVELESVPSATPFIEVEGVRVHSGDLLLSRGGAPTSALIARGSDFPNTFSHVALAHVDGDTGQGTVVESLIEAGSVLSSVESYLESKKHKILVLRLRPDHPALADDPMLPHRAATEMLERLRGGNVPYDFAMTWDEPSRMFCSEVVHHAYAPHGVELWSIRSEMTAPGLVRWLSRMGVREFRTLVPSDLEYDAQLRGVAEWRDREALMEYRLDNAIIDALLDEADRGADLGYPWYALPVARLLKAISVGQSRLGGRPTIPTGMSADAALRVSALVSTVDPLVEAELVEREAAFAREHGYRAPYWTLVELARASLVARREELGPALR